MVKRNELRANYADESIKQIADLINSIQMLIEGLVNVIVDFDYVRI